MGDNKKQKLREKHEKIEFTTEDWEIKKEGLWKKITEEL